MTDTPGWMPPTDPGASGDDSWAQPPPPPPAGQPGPPPGYDPAGQPGPPPGYGPGYGPPGPGAPHGYAPPGSFGAPGYAPGYGPGYGTPGYGYPGYGGYPPSQYGHAWGRGAPEPGIIPLRPLGLGEILDGGIAIVRKYPRVTIGLAAIVTTATQLLNFLIQLPDALNQGAVDPDAFGGFTVAQVAGMLVNGIAVVILAGMLTSVMGEAVLGRATTIGRTWEKVRPRFWALIGAGILGGIVPYVGLVACLIPGIFLWGAWAFLTPVVVLERAGVGTAIRRSWRLAVPDWWRVWGIRALATIIAMFISSIIVVPFTIVAVGSTLFSANPEHIGVLPLTLLTLGGIIAGTVTAPFTSGVLALLYIDRRMRVEGLDVTLAQAAAQQPAGTA